ncbi:protein Red-like [Antedon mediterranea]|uniref:protein Red-like n=1 Tax=Antedon mediterranea TaxID=105859 RepID=UPI003AF57B81
MPEKGEEPFSNPLPPMMDRRMMEETDQGGSQMTNDDFRRLLMTPRATPGEAPPSSMSSSSSKSREHKTSVPREYNEDDDPRAKRRKRKIFYAKLKKQEAEREAELAKRYRDRARERREGKTDYEETEMVSTTANYRAVAPDVQSGDTAANRRKQLIEESKYLGGDMEHTHLVKGLDYALLQKVRAEITHKEKEEEEVMEESFKNAIKEETKEPVKEVKKPVVEDEHISFKTRVGKNVYRTLFKKRPPERNELFLPGRMAYKVELDDDYAESDIPTTVIRSKADCPTMESHTTLTANDIVINKLTQILSYLRQGQRGRKLKKKEKGKLKEEMKEKLPGHDDNIFNDVGDYAPPSFVKPKSKEERREKSSKTRDRGGRSDDRDHKHRSYFEKPQDRGEGIQESRSSSSSTGGKDLVQNIIKKYGSSKQSSEPDGRFAGTFTTVDKKSDRHEDKRSRGKHRGGKSEDPGGSYAECYPGLMESIDACDDSDDEADYSKMDLGNKKGPLSRWDFETQDDYSSYMNNKEAMPKAAFQFGLKMSEGRKTRRVGGQKNEKAELDKEWNKIQQIIAKRKATGTGDGSGGNYKKSKGY